MSIPKFITANLIAIHKGTVLAKLKSSLFLSLGFSPIAYIIETFTNWSIVNQDYISVVLLAIVIDHIVGSYLHAFVKKDFTFKKNFLGVALKITLVVMVGILFEGLNHITKTNTAVQEYLVLVTRITVFLYPAGSALMNVSVITNGKFPPMGWIKKIQKFNENLEIPKETNNPEE